MHSVRSQSAKQTLEVGRSLANLLAVGDLIIMSGDLGAGKTQLTKGIALGLGVAEPVTSPTFAIANQYQGSILLHHLDVYRFESSDEMYEAFDLAELQSTGVVVIEWGEVISAELGSSYLEIELTNVDEDDCRSLQVKPVGPDWETRYEEIRSL